MRVELVHSEPTTQPMAVWLDEVTRQALERLDAYVQDQERRDRVQHLRRGEPEYAASALSDDEYAHWKVVQREMSALYQIAQVGDGEFTRRI